MLSPQCVAVQTHYHSAEWYIKQGLPLPAGMAKVRLHRAYCMLYPVQSCVTPWWGIGQHAEKPAPDVSSAAGHIVSRRVLAYEALAA